MGATGLYVHIPYCRRKCGYCDFYSVCDMSTTEQYVRAVCNEIESKRFTADTLYIGGGTPSQLSAEQLGEIIASAKSHLTADAEITIEMNPGDRLEQLLPKLAAQGVNRLSFGMQSADDGQLKQLGRRHNFAEVKRAVEIAKENGISNISLDLMLGIEGQNEASIDKALEYVFAEQLPHLSAYLLKIEAGTPFARNVDKMNLPTADRQAELYEHLCQRMAAAGYEHYEISNFCKTGYRSRHNMKYWKLEEYIGVGAAAHSYYEGKRNYYPRDIAGYIEGAAPIADGEGGGIEEYIMLGLRTSDGIEFSRLDKYRGGLSAQVKEKAEQLSIYINVREDGISLTEQGYLVSNAVLGEIINII